MDKTKKLFFMMLVAMMCHFTASYSQFDFETTYFADGECPDGTKFLPEPPALASSSFYDDFYYYQWGKTVRDTELGAVAKEQDSQEVVDIYTDVIGFQISPQGTPEIYKFCQWLCNDVHNENKHSRNYFQRTRPFVQFNEPSAIPENDEDKSQSWGYPSGHAARSYAYALTLSCLMPQKSAEIMDFAESYALGRVICGHHYKSDVDASFRLATTLFASAVGLPKFLTQLENARQEYASMIEPTEVKTTKEEAVRLDTPIYDLSGRKMSDPQVGVFIRNGKKYLKMLSR